jgi:hypothetical protein
MDDQTLLVYDGPTDDQSVMNLVSGPGFKGDLDRGINWHCPGCQAVIAEAIYPGQLLNLVFRCYSCAQLSASPVRAPGQPLPGRPVITARGEFYLKTVVVTDKPVLIAGYQARDGYLNETAAPPIPFAAATGEQIELGAGFLRELASRAIRLLGSNYLHLQASGRKSAASPTPKRQIPRLMKLISYAEEAAKIFERQEPGVPINIDGDQISELYGTVGMFERWRNHPAWPQLVNTLATETEGPHSLMLLTAASYLNASGNGIGIVFKKTTGRIPDLWIESDLLHKINVEIKTPQAFRNVWPGTLSADEAEKVITRQIDKAASTRRGQLGAKSPGVVAIGAFHLPTGGLDQLVSVASGLLRRQAKSHRKPNLVGVLLSDFGFTTEPVNGNRQSVGFTPTLTNKFVSHPGYRGSVRIEEGLPRWTPGFPGDISNAQKVT